MKRRVYTARRYSDDSIGSPLLHIEIERDGELSPVVRTNKDWGHATREDLKKLHDLLGAVLADWPENITD